MGVKDGLITLFYTVYDFLKEIQERRDHNEDPNQVELKQWQQSFLYFCARC